MVMKIRPPDYNMRLARTAWGKPLPDWIEALAKACDALGQHLVGLRLGYDTYSSVSHVLHRKIGAAATESAERRVRKALMKSERVTPVPVLVADAKGRRTCLRCGKRFASAWAGNRLCQPCTLYAAHNSSTLA